MVVTFFQTFSTITKECEIKFYFLICIRLNICKIITLYYDWTIYFYILNNSIRMKIELSLYYFHYNSVALIIIKIKEKLCKTAFYCIYLQYVRVVCVSHNLKIKYVKVSLLKYSIYLADWLDCRQTLRILKNSFFRHRIYAMKWTMGVSRSRYGAIWGGGVGWGCSEFL